MKKKEFKEYLKNEIVEILSEASADDVQTQKDLNKELEKTAELSKDLTEADPEDITAQSDLNKELEATKGHRDDLGDSLSESLNPEVVKALDRFIKAVAKRYDYSEQDAVFTIQAALKQREFDKPTDMPGFEGTMDALDSLSIRENEDEPSSSDLKKEKSIAKEKSDILKAQKEAKEKISKIKKDLKQNKSEMLKISKIDRKNRTKSEQALFDKMADKTKELKKLEKAL